KTDDFVNFRLQFRVGMSAQTVARRLNPLSDIRVPEDVRRRLHARFPVETKVVDTARLLTDAVYKWQRLLAVYLKARRPKRIIDGNRLPGNRCPCWARLLHRYGQRMALF